MQLKLGTGDPYALCTLLSTKMEHVNYRELSIKVFKGYLAFNFSELVPHNSFSQ